MLRGTKSSMVINGKRLHMAEFDIEVGVRQGCVLSPTLFSIFFDGLVRDLHGLGKGVRYYDLDAEGGGNGLIGSLFYADDIVLLAESDEDLQAMLAKVEAYSKKWRFELSVKKTKVVVYGSGEADVDLDDAFHVGDVALKVLTAYKYLGMEVEENLTSWKTFKERILTKATKVMRASWGMGLQSGCMSAKGGAKLWTTFARPILEYGAEIWEREGDHKWKEAEKIQKEMGVKILRCSKTAADAFVRGELGWWTLRASG